MHETLHLSELLRVKFSLMDLLLFYCNMLCFCISDSNIGILWEIGKYNLDNSKRSDYKSIFFKKIIIHE